MKVAFFRTLQPKRQILAGSINFISLFLSKIDKQIDQQLASVSSLNLIQLLTDFGPNFDYILAPFFELLEPVGSHFGCPATPARPAVRKLESAAPFSERLDDFEDAQDASKMPS